MVISCTEVTTDDFREVNRFAVLFCCYLLETELDKLLSGIKVVNSPP